jgi:predicted O-linked N-acetylglucosamine transferase (SPINDLY family)
MAQHPNFVDVEKESDAAAADIIKGRNLDVLVELKGWTRFTRMGIAARRPAPVQIGYLGFPGTSGAGFIDHLMVDRFVVPEAERAQYRETLLYLPACYLVTDNTDPIGLRPTRAQFGLSDDSFVLCSFNRSLKVSEANFLAWLDILRRVPRAVLWMSAGSDAERANVRRMAQAGGIHAERIVFASRVEDKAGHLARMGLADLALDTWRYNGHTSTIDALWAGVPVLAKSGAHFASRVSESIMAATGLGAMVAPTPEAYVDMACAFASGARDIAPVRAAVARARIASPLFDTAKFTRDFLTLVAGTVR